MQYLLDTHVLLWWHTANPSLSGAHQRAIARSHSRGLRIGVSDITLWEVALLARRGRLRAHKPVGQWLAELESDPFLEVFSISAAIADEATSFGTRFPGNPADRIIAATARCHGLTLLTEDGQIRRSGVVRVL